MNRLAAAALVLVIGVTAVILLTGLDQSSSLTVAQSDGSEGGDVSGEEFVPERPGQIEDPGRPNFQTGGWSTNFDISSVPFDEIFSGGPGKDGIPAVDEPRFESIEKAREWLTDKSPVIALEIDGDARAYPLAILMWHEITNDVVADVPVTVTFCPLCHTALVYDRTLDGVTHDFGVSGNLRFSDMVMYDRQTETWWQQATGIGIVGELTGAKLDFIPSQIVGLAQFEEAYPDGVVMSRDTGHSRNYGVNPYGGYDDSDPGSGPWSGEPRLFFGVTDGRVAAKERVLTLGEQDTAEPISFPYTELRKVGAVNIDFDGEPVVALWVPGAASAMDASFIDDSEDVGATGVFSRVVGDQVLTFSRDGEGEDAPIVDAETGSTWDITGQAIDGLLEGKRLERIGHGDHFWFAWAAFVPHTSIWTTDGIVTIDDTAA